MKGNPYVGPRPYEREDRHRFYGRDREARELRALIVAERVVLFYAQSGAGKTSLLNTRVIPALEEKGFHVLPVVRVGSELPLGIDPQEVDNVFVFGVLTALAGEEIPPETLLHHTLRSFLESFCPEENDTVEYRPPVLIFDQFEELFTTHRDRWQDAGGFFRQVREALDALPGLGVVFAMREDRVAELDPYVPLFPRRLRARFRMERLRKRAALSAVEGPLADTQCAFEEGVAEQLVEELLKTRVTTAPGKAEVVTGEFVEPVQLQVVCQSLWRDLPPDVTVITQDHLRAFGDVNQALSGFYERSIKKAAQEPGVGEGDLREWFEHTLITPAGTRGTVYRGREETGGIANPVVDELQNLHLIRGEWRAGARWYELTHDRFIGPIKKSNEAWRTARRERWLRIGGGAVITLAVLIFVLVGIVARLKTVTTETVQESQVTATAASALQAMATADAAESSELEVTATAAAAESSELEITATAVAADSSELAISVTRARTRPLKPGLSVSGMNVTAGTIGAFVRDAKGELYLLSAAHVLGLPDYELGSPVVQPGQMDGGQEPADVIGYSARSLSLADWVSMAHLVGLARLEEGVTFETIIPGIGPIREVRDPTLGMSVRMLGRASGLATGEISVVDVTAVINLGEQNFRFVNGIATSPMSQGGDSGALVVDEEGYAIGVVVAGSESQTFLSPMQDVLDSLGVRLVLRGQELFTLEGHSGHVLSAVWSPDRARIVTAGQDGTARLWNAWTGEVEAVLRGHEDEVNSAVFSRPDGQLVATASRDGTARVWEVATGKELVVLRHGGGVLSVAFSPDGRLLVTGSHDDTARIWDVTTGEELAVLQHDGSVWSAVFSLDGQRIVTASWDDTARVWEMDTGEELVVLRGHEAAVRSAVFSPDGQWVATASADETARVWETATGREVARLEHGDAVSAVAFSPDGTRLATASADATAWLWDVDSGEKIAELAWHAAEINDVAWSPDGAQIVIVSSDDLATVWDAAGGELLFVLEGHTDEVLHAAWSPDGTRIVTAGGDGTARVWQGR